MISSLFTTIKQYKAKGNTSVIILDMILSLQEKIRKKRKYPFLIYWFVVISSFLLFDDYGYWFEYACIMNMAFDFFFLHILCILNESMIFFCVLIMSNLYGELRFLLCICCDAMLLCCCIIVFMEMKRVTFRILKNGLAKIVMHYI